MRSVTLSGLVALLALAGSAVAQTPVTPPAPKTMPLPVSSVPILAPTTTGVASESVVAFADNDANDPANWKVLRVNAEYLLWWMKKAPVPVPLVTGTTQNPPNFDFAAGLVDPSTVVLFGANNIDFNARHGGRLTVDWALTDIFDVQVRAFAIGQRTFKRDFFGDGAGNPVLFRPQVNMEPPFVVDPGPPPVFAAGSPNAGNPVSFPTFSGNGVINIRAASELWGAELNGVAHLTRGPAWSISAIAGFRFLALDEDLQINDGGTNLPVTAPGTGGGYFFLGTLRGEGYRLETFDSFGTLNHFYGGQVGVEAERQFGRLTFNTRAKLAIGGTVQRLNIAGSSGSVAPADPALVTEPTQVAYFGGILTTPANIGRHTRSVFAVVPEINLNLGFDAFAWLRLTVGYSLLYWSNVIRPGEQIDLLVNQANYPSGQGFTGTVVGNPYPRILFNQSDFWAHGLNFSAEFRY